MRLAKHGFGPMRAARNTSRFLAASASAYLMILCAGACYAEDRKRLAEQLQQVRSALEEFRSRFDRTDPVTYTSSLTVHRRNEPGRLLGSAESVIKRSGENLLVKTENKSTSGLGTCFCINSKYCFELSKKRPSDAWNLSKLVVDPGPDFDSTKHGFSQPYSKTAGRTDRAATDIRGMAQTKIEPDRIESLPGFTFESTEQGGPAGEFVSLRFSFSADKISYPNTAKPVSGVIQTTLTLDKTSGHLPTRLHQRTSHGDMEMVVDVRREYVLEAGMPVRMTTNQVTKALKGSKVVHNVEAIEKHIYNYESIPVSDFTLSAFGFPEPHGVAWERRTPVYVWLIAVGVVCVAAFVVMRVRVRPRS